MSYKYFITKIKSEILRSIKKFYLFKAKYISKRKRRKIRRYIKAIAKEKYDRYPEICIVMQSFNKSHIVKKVLAPFLNSGFANIIFFCDGCVDNTLTIANRMLKGQNHLVIVTNNRHEIYNYGIAKLIPSREMECEYLLLVQDDDIYMEDTIHCWIENSVKLMETRSRMSIIGLAGGAFTEGNLQKADKELCNVEFTTYKENGEVYSRLGRYMKLRISQLKATSDGSNWGLCEIVWRAPQLIRTSFLDKIDSFPEAMRPYQYDDDWHCLQAWNNGWEVAHMPISSVERDVGIGGMRLINNVSRNSRPIHFVRNHNKLYNEFRHFWGSKKLKAMLKATQVDIDRGPSNHSGHTGT